MEKDYEDDEMIAAEVLLNLRRGRIQKKQDIKKYTKTYKRYKIYICGLIH